MEIEFLATVSWKWGWQPFSCRCSQNVTHCRTEICWTCLFKESIPSIPFWNSKHPTYQKLELPESCVRSAISALNHGCIMRIPSLQLQKKIVLWREAESLVTELWSPRFVQYSDCALSCAMRLLQKVNNCRDWDFSNSEMDVWLPAFQLPMFPKCDALPKGDLLDMFVEGIHAFCKI